MELTANTPSYIPSFHTNYYHWPQIKYFLNCHLFSACKVTRDFRESSCGSKYESGRIHLQPFPWFSSITYVTETCQENRTCEYDASVFTIQLHILPLSITKHKLNKCQTLTKVWVRSDCWVTSTFCTFRFLAAATTVMRT
jgi:hypothetical protein